jgi:hypothetical protein
MMNQTLTLTLALAAVLLGGTFSRYVTPTTTVFAQAQLPAPKEIRAQRFTLVDERGICHRQSGAARRLCHH